MKPLLVTASAIALMIGATACNQSKSEAQTASLDQPVTETPAATTNEANENLTADVESMSRAEIAAETHADYTLASDELLASDLIGASVQNPAGEDIATVADVWIGEDGDAPKLILRESGVAGIGGTLHAISFDAAKILPVSGEDEPDVRVTYSEASLETLPEFEQNGLDDFRLASEVMGATASLPFGDNLLRVKDFVLKQDGTPEYVVVADGMAGMDLFVIDADALKIEQGDGDGSVMIDLDADTLAKAKMLKRDK